MQSGSGYHSPNWGDLSSRRSYYSPMDTNRSTSSRILQHPTNGLYGGAYNDTTTISNNNQRSSGTANRFSLAGNSLGYSTSGGQFSPGLPTYARSYHQRRQHLQQQQPMMAVVQDKSLYISMIGDRIREIESECEKLKNESNIMQRDLLQHATWKRRNEILDKETNNLNTELASYNLYNEIMQTGGTGSHSGSKFDLANKVEELRGEVKKLQDKLGNTLKSKKNSEQERQILVSRLKNLDTQWEQLGERLVRQSAMGRPYGQQISKLNDGLKKVRSEANRLKEQMSALEAKIRAYQDESEATENKRLIYVDQVIKLRRLQQDIKKFKSQEQNGAGGKNVKNLTKEELARLRNTRKHERELIGALKKQTEDLKNDLKARNVLVESLKDNKFISSLVKGCLEIEKVDKFCEEYETAIKRANLEKLEQLTKEMSQLKEKQDKSIRHMKTLEDAASSRDKQSLMEIINIKRRLEIDVTKLDSLKPKYDSEIKRFKDEINLFIEEESSLLDPVKVKDAIEKKIDNIEMSIRELETMRDRVGQQLKEYDATYERLMKELQDRNTENGHHPTALETSNIVKIMTLRDDCNKLHDSIMKKIQIRTTQLE